MAKRTPPSPLPLPANLTPADMRRAIPKLKRRLEELKSFRPEDMKEAYDPAGQKLMDKIHATLTDVFGHQTVEYNRYNFSLYTQRSISLGHGPSRHVITKEYNNGKQNGIHSLEGAIEYLEESLEDLGGSSQSPAPNTLEGFNIQCDILNEAGGLYRDGHYSESIEAACKALSRLVQDKSGIHESDNTKLMSKVFSPNNPILAFNELKNPTDISEQQGLMHLYQGVFLAFRNPRAHRLTTDSAEYAFDVILFISFLAKILENSQ